MNEEGREFLSNLKRTARKSEKSLRVCPCDCLLTCQGQLKEYTDAVDAAEQQRSRLEEHVDDVVSELGRSFPSLDSSLSNEDAGNLLTSLQLGLKRYKKLCRGISEAHGNVAMAKAEQAHFAWQRGLADHLLALTNPSSPAPSHADAAILSAVEPYAAVVAAMADECAAMRSHVASLSDGFVNCALAAHGLEATLRHQLAVCESNFHALCQQHDAAVSQLFEIRDRERDHLDLLDRLSKAATFDSDANRHVALTALASPQKEERCRASRDISRQIESFVHSLKESSRRTLEAEEEVAILRRRVEELGLRAADDDVALQEANGRVLVAERERAEIVAEVLMASIRLTRKGASRQGT
jgi:polyhydroxyalkanoate synthesis regulator phasin